MEVGVLFLVSDYKTIDGESVDKDGYLLNSFGVDDRKDRFVSSNPISPTISCSKLLIEDNVNFLWAPGSSTSLH